MNEVMNYVEQEMAHAEGLKIVHDSVSSRVVAQKRSHGLDGMDEATKLRRCSTWFLRDRMLCNALNMRAGMRDTLEKRVGFLVRKVWSLGGVSDARRAGFYFSFTEGQHSHGSEETVQNAYYMAISETKTVPVGCTDVHKIREADRHNQQLLDEVIERFLRLVVEMWYTVRMDSPKYESEKIVRRSLQCAGKRSFSQMNGRRGTHDEMGVMSTVARTGLDGHW